MKEHFIKKYIFAVLFMILLFGYAALNFVHELPELKESVKTFKVTKADKCVKEIEATVNDNVYEKYTLIEAYGITQNILATNVENGFAYIKAKDGALSYAKTDELNSEILEKNISEMEQIVEYARAAKATPVIMFGLDNYIEGQTEYESGLPYDKASFGFDKVYEKFGDQVEIFDYRGYLETIKEITGENILYNTDHHWRSLSAFYIYSFFTKFMEEKCNLVLDNDELTTDLNSYNVISYKDYFLGSQGRETGVSYSGLDDFDLIIPKFDTDFTHTFKGTEHSEEKVASGKYIDSILIPYNMQTKGDIYSTDRYSTYLSSVNYIDKITNNKNEELPRVLIVRDSFMAPVAAFMASNYSELDMVWSTTFNGDLEEMINEGNYDYVIIEVGASNLAETEEFLKCIEVEK